MIFSKTSLSTCSLEIDETKQTLPGVSAKARARHNQDARLLKQIQHKLFVWSFQRIVCFDHHVKRRRWHVTRKPFDL